MTEFRDRVVAAHKRGIVARAITCPRTGEVLDIRTAVFLLDRDGDPAYVMSPSGFGQLTGVDLHNLLTKHGVTVDETSVDISSSASRQHYIDTGVYLTPSATETQEV